MKVTSHEFWIKESLCVFVFLMLAELFLTECWTGEVTEEIRGCWKLLETQQAGVGELATVCPREPEPSLLMDRLTHNLLPEWSIRMITTRIHEYTFFKILKIHFISPWHWNLSTYKYRLSLEVLCYFTRFSPEIDLFDYIYLSLSHEFIVLRVVREVGVEDSAKQKGKFLNVG